MIKKIQQFFERLEQESVTGLSEQDKQLAACVLMLEVAAIDHNFAEEEINVLTDEMKRQFKLDEETHKELIELAHSEQANAASLHQFTKQIHDHCSKEEKFELVVGMWRVAYADDHLDKYEEYIIRKISDLLYIRHTDFLKAKKLAQGGQ